MRARSKNRKKVMIILGSVFLIAAIAVVGISYMALRRLTFTGKYDEIRIRKNEKAKKIRKRLIATHNAREIHFYARDGVMLDGLFIERTRPEGTMILCHGYRSNKETMQRFVKVFPHYNMLFFDFRAHGLSEGNYTSIGAKEHRDIIAASDWLKKEMKENRKLRKLPVIIIGISMGGAAAIKAAAKEKNLCDALVIDSSYADLWEIVTDVFTAHSGLPYYPFLPVVELLYYLIAGQNIRKMKPIEYIKKITKPLLLIHSCYDDHTAPENTLRMYKLADPKFVDLWVGPKCHHGHLHRVYPGDYHQAIRSFLEKARIV